MFVAGDKKISFAHIAMLEWLPGTVDAKHPRTGAALKVYAFNVHTSYNHVEQMLYETDAQRRKEWDQLIYNMEKAGY